MGSFVGRSVLSSIFDRFSMRSSPRFLIVVALVKMFDAEFDESRFVLNAIMRANWKVIERKV